MGSAALAFFAISGSASAFTQQEPVVTSFDGTKLATTLYVPDGAAPAGGWPAVVLFHGLGGNRAEMGTIAASMGLIGEQYVVLTVDARGHGESGGLFEGDGPNEVRDVQALYSWLAARPDVADARIGALGISLGGGAIYTSLAAGVPWAAIEVAESWTDLRTAFLPQGLSKSGVIAGFIGSLPPERVAPSVFAVRDARLHRCPRGPNAFAAERSTIAALKGVKTPAFFMQGRRDFAFGMGQALQAYNAVAGPKRLWLGLHGHAPSTFPGPRHGLRCSPRERSGSTSIFAACRSRSIPSRSPSRPRTGAARPVRFADAAEARLPDAPLRGLDDDHRRREGAAHVGATQATARNLRRAGRHRLGRRERRLDAHRRRPHGEDAPGERRSSSPAAASRRRRARRATASTSRTRRRSFPPVRR